MSHRIASSAAARVAARASSSTSGGAIGYLSAPSAAAAAAPAVCAGASAHHANPSPLACRRPITRGYGTDLSSGSAHHYLSTRLSPRLPRSRATTAGGLGRCRWRPQLLGVASASRRAIGSTPPLPKSAEPKPAAEGEAEPKAESDAKPVAAGEDDDDPCPPWQNPLHHNNPEFSKVLAEDFEPGEEVPVVPLPPFEAGDDGDDKVIAPPHIHEIADEIVRLSMLEVKELVDRVGDHFGFDDDAGFGGDDGGGDGGGAAEEEAVVEKTVFELKLTGYDAKAKIKVIKEVRAITGAGLKEAKELVEGAPTVIKKDIKKEEAEELKVKLEALGATIEIV